MVGDIIVSWASMMLLACYAGKEMFSHKQLVVGELWRNRLSMVNF